MTNEDPTVLRAALDEANALIEHLRERTLVLNVEVRKRDERIAELTTKE